MIYNLRGTNGSGKTTVARELLKKSKAVVAERTPKGRVVAYSGKLFKRSIAILGSYEMPSGGMDTIKDIREAAALVTKYCGDKKYEIIFLEGLLISHMIGTMGAVLKKFGDRVQIAFLDTPLDECLRRVMLRRKQDGNTKDFNPKNVIRDFHAVDLCRDNCLRQQFNVCDIKHEKAVAQSLSRIKRYFARGKRNA